MEITRDIILDLLPLYLANEASEDTNALVREYLEKNAELAGIAEKLKSDELPSVAPAPITREDEMEAYKEAKRLLFQRTITLAAIISAAVVVILVLAALAWFFFKG